MRYETWWIVHLYMYLALGLSFAHQVANGTMFKGHPLTTAAWTTLWILIGILLVGSRLTVPLVRNLRHQLRVESVTKVAPSVYAVTLRDASCRASRVRVASSSSGGSSRGACGGTCTPTRCPRSRAPRSFA